MLMSCYYYPIQIQYQYHIILNTVYSHISSLHFGYSNHCATNLENNTPKVCSPIDIVAQSNSPNCRTKYNTILNSDWLTITCIIVYFVPQTTIILTIIGTHELTQILLQSTVAGQPLSLDMNSKQLTVNLWIDNGISLCNLATRVRL